MQNFRRLLFIFSLFHFLDISNAQNIGIGILSPEAKLHIKGSVNVSQFIVEANITQSNLQPLIKMRKSDGTDLMWIHSDHSFNTFVGYNAGGSNTAGGPFGDDGILNTFIGSESGRSNTTGTQNTATGYTALYANTIGYGNTASGKGALFSNPSASQNTAVGTNALYIQSFNPGYAWSSDNVAVGFEALYSNQPLSVEYGRDNTAVGSGALRNNIGGFSNTAIGMKALYFNTGGFSNTASGSEALYLNTYGSFNTAGGEAALFNNSEGHYNTAFGHDALHSNTTGSYNTAIGYDTRNDMTASEFNTIIGSEAHVGLGAYNSVVLGVGSYTNTSNLALLGNTGTMHCGGYVNWSNFSDGRFKTGVQENVKGLDFIMRLRPVTYHMNIRGLHKFWGIDEEISHENKFSTVTENAIVQKESIAMNGFIAQEVEKAAYDAEYVFDGVHKPAHDKDHYRISYATFVVPLVKAVQEQQVMIEELKNINQDLIKRLEALEKKEE